MVHYIVK